MRFGVVVAGLLAVMGTTQVAEAQGPPGRLSVFARGGGMSALADLQEGGTPRLATGFALGGGAAVDLHRYVAVRGDFTYADNDVESTGPENGTGIVRYFYGAAIQLQYPTTSGLMPYVFAGGGGVTVEPENGASKTRGQGTFGAGLRYDIKQSRVGVFIEGIGYAYRPRLTSSTSAGEKTQWDLAWTGGVSLRLF